MSLVNSQDLKKHKKLHETNETREGLFECNVCNQEFEKEIRLKHHYNSHTTISTKAKVCIPKRGLVIFTLAQFAKRVFIIPATTGNISNACT